MKLYEVKPKSWVKIAQQKIWFDHVDGIKTTCIDLDGNVVHINAYTEVEVIDDEPWWEQRLPNLSGVLCWVCDHDPYPRRTIAAIICKEKDTGLFEVRGNKWRYRYATPLTNEEIDKFKR